MIQVFSNYFKVKSKWQADFEWFITDAVGFQIAKKAVNEYCFSGLSPGYLTTFGICSSYINILSLKEHEYVYIPEDFELEEDEKPFIEVEFDTVLARFIIDSAQYVEVDLTDMSGVSTELYSTGDANYKNINLAFGNEGRS